MKNYYGRKVVESIQDLREILNSGKYEYYILLAGGVVRSSKDLEMLNDGRFKIFNYVDDSEQVLTEKELYTQSNIGKAIDNRALIVG